MVRVMKRIHVILVCILLAGCIVFPRVKFSNQSGQDLEISSGDLSFHLNSKETSEAILLADFLKHPIQIKTAECEATYSADVPAVPTTSEFGTEVARDWFGNYRRYSARVIISPTLELKLEITHKKHSSVHVIDSLGFPAKPEKLDCTSKS